MKKLCGVPIFAAFAFAQPKQELWGVWITNVDNDILSRDVKNTQGMSYGLFQKLKNISSKIMEMSDILLIEPVNIDEICCLD